MILIDGKKQSAELREELKTEVDGLREKYNKAVSYTHLTLPTTPYV